MIPINFRLFHCEFVTASARVSSSQSRGRLAPGRHASINSTHCGMMAVVSVVVTVNSGNRIESSAMTLVHILLTIAIYREVTSNDQLNVDWIGDTREVPKDSPNLRAETVTNERYCQSESSLHPEEY